MAYADNAAFKIIQGGLRRGITRDLCVPRLSDYLPPFSIRRKLSQMANLLRKYRIVLGEPFPLPICDVFLLGRHGRVHVQAVVDSGAVRPIFPLKAAQDAGFDLSKAHRYPIQYGASRTPGWILPVRLELGDDGLRLDTSVVFVERLEFPYGLLGRVGFFDRFNEVAFLHKNGRNPCFVLRS
jgi:hypothetical protein